MISLPMAPLVPNEPIQADEEQAVMGLRHCHQQMITLAQQVFEASAQVGAVVNVLHARGLITDEELAAQRQVEEQRLETLFQEKQVGVQIDQQIPDKYAIGPDAIPRIDCAARYHLCRAACCALRFPLSKQDLDEGIMRWDYGEPYNNRQGPDTYCVHLDRGSRMCSIYPHRPGICRVYDCRTDRRIWQDFDNMVINPELFAPAEADDPRPRFPKRLMSAPGQEPGAEQEQPC